MKKHQLIPNTYCVLSPKDCEKWFRIADSRGLLNSGAFNLNDEDMLYVDKDGLIYSCLGANYRNPANKLNQTLSKIPAKEFLLRLEGEWEQPNEVTEPDYKALYTELLQGVKDAKAEMEAREIKAYEIGNKEKDNDAIFAAFGLNMALEILTDKTNVL
jgi:hypothetical protein